MIAQTTSPTGNGSTAGLAYAAADAPSGMKGAPVPSKTVISEPTGRQWDRLEEMPALASEGRGPCHICDLPARQRPLRV